MPRRKAEGEYRESLDAALDQVFAAKDAKRMSNAELAVAAGLCYTTVWRADRKDMELPCYDTILRLARAVGLDLVLVGRKAKLRRAS